MTSMIDFFFDFSSAYSYVGQHRIRMLEADHRAKVSWQPICLGAIFQQRGHTPEDLNSVKGSYVKKDVEYSAKESHLPYQWPSPFPFNSIYAARLFYYLEKSSSKEAIVWARTVFNASYKEGHDCSNKEVLLKIGESLGYNPEDMTRAINDPEIKQKLMNVTDTAFERGVFGAPSFILDGELFWGADRLERLLNRLAT